MIVLDCFFDPRAAAFFGARAPASSSPREFDGSITRRTLHCSCNFFIFAPCAPMTWQSFSVGIDKLMQCFISKGAFAFANRRNSFSTFALARWQSARRPRTTRVERPGDPPFFARIFVLVVSRSILILSPPVPMTCPTNLFGSGIRSSKSSTVWLLSVGSGVVAPAPTGCPVIMLLAFMVVAFWLFAFCFCFCGCCVK